MKDMRQAVLEVIVEKVFDSFENHVLAFLSTISTDTSTRTKTVVMRLLSIHRKFAIQALLEDSPKLTVVGFDFTYRKILTTNCTFWHIFSHMMPKSRQTKTTEKRVELQKITCRKARGWADSFTKTGNRKLRKIGIVSAHLRLFDPYNH